MKTKGLQFSEWGGSLHDLSVHENVAVNTGILDAAGAPIYRPPNPVGYVTDFQRQKPVIRVKAGRQQL
jgi:hypothetical protein